MFNQPKWSCVAALAIAAVCVLVALAARAAEGDFVGAVDVSQPIAYYRLKSTGGRSEVGTTTYKSVGGVTSAGPGGPIGSAGSYYAKLNGRDGYVLTTQAGGVGGAGSILVWVSLADLPSQVHHFFYVAGESENGNDFDLQFETDNALRFYTAGGGSVEFKPAAATLVNQWHMIVTTLDTATQARTLYWDGRQVATDRGSGRPGKTGIFSIGASTVFSGRFFNGGIEDVALWNRALKASEVADIYAAARNSAAAGSSIAAVSGSGLFPTAAKVEVEDSKGPVKLKLPEQIAILFLTAFQGLEANCQSNGKGACTLEQQLPKLKYDPRTDPDYSYTLSASGMAWEAHATAKKPGLIGFCFISRSYPTVTATYSTSGNAGFVDTELTGRGVDGDSFAK